MLTEGAWKTICTTIVDASKYERCVLGSVLLGTFVMLWEPLPDSAGKRVLDLTLALIYALDLLFKTGKLGWSSKNGGYLSSAWNRLDFIVTCGQ